MLVMEKIVKSVGIELPNGKVIKSLQEGDSYTGCLVDPENHENPE